MLLNLRKPPKIVINIPIVYEPETGSDSITAQCSSRKILQARRLFSRRRDSHVRRVATRLNEEKKLQDERSKAATPDTLYENIVQNEQQVRSVYRLLPAAAYI